jgi:lipopolysaccharide transport system ATP-binding protein
MVQVVGENLIFVENLSKRYLIGHQDRNRRPGVPRDAANLRLVIRSGIASFSRKIVRLASGEQQVQGDEIEEFWALRNVSFEVKRGEVLGIIGRNGAGKSTLLKILSRITEPSEGRVVLNGRLASLLEVGTGFHPELTGRENIFLNGAILGMSRKEIRQKLDEMIEFAQIERFIDTPVKRYSSGMYVRLAFAVAAHLEPEILVVDEVLAVGDSDFQKKCLGKMREVSVGGRTVLLVSHNMSAIRSLTSRCIVMSEGGVVFDGNPADAIIKYADVLEPREEVARSLGHGECTAIEQVRLVGEDGVPTNIFTSGVPLRIDVVFSTKGGPAFSIEIVLVGADRQKLALASLQGFHGATLPSKAGVYKTRLEIEPLWLASGEYSVDVATSITNSGFDHYVEDALSFEVLSCNRGNQVWDFKQNYGIGSFALGYLHTPTFERIR